MRESMPFFYSLLMYKLTGTSNKTTGPNLPSEEDDCLSDASSDSESEESSSYSPAKRNKRCHSVATTICSAVSFISNRRRNGLQLANAVVMLACGVSERVGSYLHYIGLSASRKSAQRALQSLGRHAQQAIKKAAHVVEPVNFAPIICIDNVDFEEHIHSKSAERQSRMFHGTWGYLHRFDPVLLKTVDPEDLSLPAYKAAIAQSADMVVRPSLFLPTNEENIHFREVLKSQITTVLLRYIATPNDKDHLLPLVPPVIDQINPCVPDITTLKLMLASDNSAEGIGEVFESITKQLKLEKSDFFGRLQVFEGDLGTCLNIESLRAQRKPSRHVEDAFSNCFTLLGASHILWNFAQRLLLYHFGDNTDANDLGAWHCLEALNIPSKRPTAKNDFTLMIAHIQKVH
ncbi:hypothetical protein, variant, partial [Puccinia triticina 1-1 BBBD Race 1]